MKIITKCLFSAALLSLSLLAHANPQVVNRIDGDLVGDVSKNTGMPIKEIGSVGMLAQHMRKQFEYKNFMLQSVLEGKQADQMRKFTASTGPVVITTVFVPGVTLAEPECGRIAMITTFEKTKAQDGSLHKYEQLIEVNTCANGKQPRSVVDVGEISQMYKNITTKKYYDLPK